MRNALGAKGNGHVSRPADPPGTREAKDAFTAASLRALALPLLQGKAPEINRELLHAMAQLVVSLPVTSKERGREGFPTHYAERAQRETLQADLEGVVLAANSEQPDGRKKPHGWRLLLESTLALTDARAGFKPTALEVLALVALHPQSGGLIGPAVPSTAMMMRDFEHRDLGRSKEHHWVGSAENLIRALLCRGRDGERLAPAVLNAFANSPGKVLSTQQLVQRLQHCFPPEDLKSHLNRVLNLLHTALVIDQQVSQKAPNGKMCSAWALAGTPVRKGLITEPELLVLHHACRGDGWLADLYGRELPGVSAAAFSHHAIMGAAKLLEKLGFVAIVSAVRPSPSATARKDLEAAADELVGTLKEGCYSKDGRGRAGMKAARVILTPDGQGLVAPWYQCRVGCPVPRQEFDIIRRALVGRIALSEMMHAPGSFWHIVEDVAQSPPAQSPASEAPRHTFTRFISSVDASRMRT